MRIREFLEYKVSVADICRSWLFGCVMAVGMTGCSMIDEDLSDCIPEQETEYDIDYELRLVTNISTEINTVLTTETELNIAQDLRTHLSSVFTDYAHDVDLSFYDTQGDSARLQHDEHIMNANQASYELSLPKQEYMHLASANLMDNELVNIVNSERCHRAVLSQADRDTIDSHNTGVFTARQPMNVKEGVDQSFNVQLYMANCAAALVIDPRELTADGIRVFSTGFATGFSICDSAYQYVDKAPIVRTNEIRKSGNQEAGQPIVFCSVTFPSRDLNATRTVIETTDPFVAEPTEKTLWEFRAYMPHGDGTYTESILGVKEPLRAGQLKIIKCWLADDGTLRTNDQTVTVSVSLDWRPGHSQVVPL